MLEMSRQRRWTWGVNENSSEENVLASQINKCVGGCRYITLYSSYNICYKKGLLSPRFLTINDCLLRVNKTLTGRIRGCGGSHFLEELRRIFDVIEIRNLIIYTTPLEEQTIQRRALH